MLFSPDADPRLRRCGNAHCLSTPIPRVHPMESHRPHPKGSTMSLYIATTLLAIAAAVITATDLVVPNELPGSAPAVMLVRP